MIDFHSHILPGIDDGSKSTKMSLEMLAALRVQGADTVAATPHFYATQRSVGRFLERRAQAAERLRARLPAEAPRILLGAEVLYFPGVGRMEELEELCLEGTRLLLLEMPFTTWSEYMVREVNELARSGRVTLMLAHMERYYYQQEPSVWDELLDNGVFLQSNAEFFLRFRTRRKALQLLRDGYIHVLGTDCHNMGSRAPRLGEARRRIEKHLGAEALRDVDETGEELLRKDG